MSAFLTLHAQGNPKPSAELWVDSHASSGGDGSTGKPFNTIQQAARVAVAGDTIHVRPGIYRERVMPERGGEPGRPIVYQSEVLHGAVVKGSDLWSPPWRKEGGGIFSGELSDGLFTDNGYVDGGNPYRVSYYYFSDQKRPRPPHPFAKVTWTLGQVFADGHPLQETSSKKELAVTRQAWWFDPAENRIEVNLGGKNPQDQSIEITTRRGVFRPQKKGLGYIEVRGFVFEDCANQFPGEFWKIPQNAQSGMVGTRGGHHWVIAENIIRNAKSVGLTFGTSGGTSKDNEWPPQVDPEGHLVGFHRITGNIFESNGAVGAMGFGHHGVEICSNLFTANNALLNTSYETGGIKTHFAYDLRIEHNWFIDNNCEGAWLDNTWKNCRVARNIFLGNRGKNLFFEMDDNGQETESCVFCNVFLPGRPELEPASLQPPQPWKAWSVGIYGHDACGIRIEQNLFAGEGYGLYFRKMADRKGGAAHLVASNNLFVGDKLTAVCLPVENPPIVQGNYFDANIYPETRQPSAATGWSLPLGRVDQRSVERIFKLAGGAAGNVTFFGKLDQPPAGYRLSLEQWRNVMGFDRQSCVAKIGCSFDRKNWILTLTVPEQALQIPPKDEAKAQTDFFGRSFSGGGMVGPFANRGVGRHLIQLPAPNFALPVSPAVLLQ